jgi:hypothetical protein
MSMVIRSGAHRRTRHALFLVAAFLGLAGCSSLDAPQQPRALNVAGLARQEDGTLAWRSPQWTLRRLRIEADSVVFAPEVAIEPSQSQNLREALVQNLRLELQAAGLAVAEPGDAEAPRVHAVVTGVRLAQPLLNAAATVLLIGAVSRGGLDVELEVVTPLQQRMAALVFSGRSGLLNVADGLSATGHAQQQARQAARRFARLLAARADETLAVDTLPGARE